MDREAGNARSVLHFTGGPITAPPEVPLSLVACISNERTGTANLLASPCLQTGSPHEVILVKNCDSAADGLNLGIERAKHAGSWPCTRMFFCREVGTKGCSSSLKSPRANSARSASPVSTAWGPPRRIEAASDGEHERGRGDAKQVAEPTALRCEPKRTRRPEWARTFRRP